jgi:hypothetical protein
MPSPFRVAAFALLLAVGLAAAGSPHAEEPDTAQPGAESDGNDRHTGYYYPAPGTVETYTARADTLIDSDRTRRIGFTIEITQQMLKNPYPPQFAMFAKGEEAEKLIIVSLQEGRLDTLFRARALLAMLTSVARATPLFQDFGVADYFTFFDLLKILGFRQLTVSDGDDFAHQVLIE